MIISMLGRVEPGRGWSARGVDFYSAKEADPIWLPSANIFTR